MINLYVVSYVLFSFLGWIWESIYCTIEHKEWANRGFLYGPVCPIYGCGGVIGLAFVQLVSEGILPDLNWWQLFVAGFIVSMILEYPTSWLLEKLFHARWWDYTDVPLNIRGRTSVPTSVGFGAASILAVKMLLPFMSSFLLSIPDWFMNVSALVFMGVICSDITLTVSAITNFQKRVVEADAIFQNHMIDAVEHAFALQNKVHQMAVKRIVSLRLSNDRAEKMHLHADEKELMESINIVRWLKHYEEIKKED